MHPGVDDDPTLTHPMAKRGDYIPSDTYTAKKVVTLPYPRRRYAQNDKVTIWVDQYGPRAPVEPWKHVRVRCYQKIISNCANQTPSLSNVTPIIVPCEKPRRFEAHDLIIIFVRFMKPAHFDMSIQFWSSSAS